MPDDEINGEGGGAKTDLQPEGPITREELYELVWSGPLTHAAKRYGVTDVAIAKWCRKLNVPKPGRGYWQRVKTGRVAKKTALPNPRKGHPTSVPRPRLQSTPAMELRETPQPPPGRERFPGTLVVPTELENPHRLVHKTRGALRRARKDEYGIRHPKGDGVLVVRVTEEQVERALRIADALIRALEDAGYQVATVSVVDEHGRQTEHRSSVTIDGEDVTFYLMEKRLRTERAPTDKERRDEERWSHYPGRKYYEYGGSGKLSLVLGEPKSYGSRGRVSDTKHRPLEARLVEFVEMILWDAVRRKEARLEAEERQRRWAEEERLRKEAQERRLRELQRRAYLEMLMERWRRAEAIRRFAEATEFALTSLGIDRPAVSDQEWLAWARWYADLLDPLVGQEIVLNPPEDWTHDPENLRSAVQSINLQLDRALELSGQRWSYGRVW